MSVNAFIGKREKPNGAEIAAVLGSAKAAWDQLLSELAQENEVRVQEWRCYSPQWGWSLRAKRKDRTILWLSPSEGRFTVLFILGDKAMKAVRQGKWPKHVVKALNVAPKYPEGTGVRLEVRSPRAIGPLKKLAVIKLQN